METHNRLRSLQIIFIVLLLVILLVKWFDKRKESPETGFPLEKIGLNFNEWQGTNLSVSDTEQGWVDQGDMIMRNYEKDDKTVYIVAIQERGDRHRVHSPVDCYSGSGWIVIENRRVSMEKAAGFHLTKMRAKKDDLHRMVYYWFTNGSEQCAGFKSHLALFLKDVIFKGRVRSWVSFQVSTDIGDDREEAEEVLKGFIADMNGGIQ